MRARRSHRGAEAVPSRRPITDAGHITNGWCESLRQELLPDVRVTVSEPGAAATELPNHFTHAATKPRSAAAPKAPDRELRPPTSAATLIEAKARHADRG